MAVLYFMPCSNLIPFVVLGPAFCPVMMKDQIFIPILIVRSGHIAEGYVLPTSGSIFKSHSKQDSVHDCL